MSTSPTLPPPRIERDAWMAPGKEEVFFRGMRVLCWLLAPYTALQGVTWATSNEDLFVNPTVYFLSFAIDAALLVFLFVTDRRYRRLQRAGDRVSAHRLAVMVIAALLAVCLIHLHWVGSMNSLHLLLILAVLMTASWALERWEIIAFYVAANGVLALIVLLEYRGVIAYAPLFSGREQIRSVFMDWRVVSGTAMNYALLLVTFSILTFRLRRAVKKRAAERQSLIDQLEDSLSRVDRLESLLPICARCKKIRNDKGYWDELETYFMRHTRLSFSHGLCPDCVKIYFDESDKPDGG